MFKKSIGIVLGLGMIFGGALTASAASFSNVQFENGDVIITGQGRETVQATFRLNLNANETVECIETDVNGDSLAPVFTLVGGDMGLQQSLVPHDVQASVMLPPNTGTYTLEVKGHGIWGGANDGCAGPVVASASFSNALHVIDNGGSSSTGGGTQSALDKLTSAIAALIAKINGTGTGTASAACTALSAKLVGTQDNTYNDANVKLQGFLLSEGASIPALKAGASFGYKGDQTRAAVSWFSSVNNCH